MMPRRLKLGLAGAGLGALLLPFVLAWPRARLESPPPTVLLLDRSGEYLAELPERPGAPLGFWPAEPVPERVAAAMIALEDRRFHAHPGVDPVAILRAISQNLGSGRRVSGASTLAMQVARMQRPGARTLGHKVLEAATALLITARFGREAVLAHYLRIAPYGNNVHGISYAARRYLAKPAEDLSWAEIAFLASIPQSPSRMNPYSWDGRRRAIARGQRVLELLAEQRVMTPAELELARAQLEAIQVPAEPRRPPEALHFVLRAREELRGRGAVSPLVRTSLDLELQAEVQGLAHELVSGWAARGAQNAAIVVVDRETREVVAYVGSVDYFDAERAGSIDFAATPRASGSTLKPFLFAHALDRGVLTPATILDDLRRTAEATENADRGYLGPLLPRVALGNSRNVPAVNLLHEVGAHQVYQLFGELELHERRVPYEHYGSGIAVGLLPVRLSDLVAAYGALAGDGRLSALEWLVGQPQSPGRRVFSEATARQLTLFLSDPMARLPTFPRMGATEYPYPVALKTGTSEGYRDAWTIAYSRRWITGAWVGRADAKPMTLIGGAASAARLVHAVMDRLHREDAAGFSDLAFGPPSDHVARRVCDRTGHLATPACERTVLEYFPVGDVPTERCEAHVSLAVDVHTGLPATAATRREDVETRTFVRLEPRYASWAAAHGLVEPPALDAHLSAGRPGDARSTLPAAPIAAPELVEPPDGIEVLRDPEAPVERSTLALAAVADPRVRQLVFYVDGRPFQLVGPPFRARWPLVPGDHTFEARLPYGGLVSRPVRVSVE